MASLQVHCQECNRKLGKAYKHVHRWLDAYARQYNGSKAHRLIRHNRDGIEYVRNRWGNGAAKAAQIHIYRDNLDYIPGIARR